MTMEKCLLCKGSEFQEILNTKDQPLARYGLSQTYKEGIKAKKYPINIVKCQNCGLIINKAFKLGGVDYTDEAVLESRVFSPGIRNFMIESSQRLKNNLNKSDMENLAILEIGCGEGFFLSQFSPNTNLFAFEPSPEGFAAEKKGINVFHQDFDLNLCNFPPPKLVIMRQVIEHLVNPVSILEDIRNLLMRTEVDSFLYLEVPNSRKTIDDNRFYDFYYEHVAYYTTATFLKLVESCGYRVISITESFTGEIIELLAIPNRNRNLDNTKYMQRIKQVYTKIIDYRSKGMSIVGWGTAGNGSALLNFCNIKTNLVEYIVDSDERKQGMFLPGTGQLVISPDKLKEIKPDVIFINSQFHIDDITENIRHLLGNQVEIITFN
jgi:hypothetical protein